MSMQSFICRRGLEVGEKPVQARLLLFPECCAQVYPLQRLREIARAAGIARRALAEEGLDVGAPGRAAEAAGPEWIERGRVSRRARDQRVEIGLHEFVDEGAAA